MNYRSFLERKVPVARDLGHRVDAGAVSEICMPHQKVAIEWMVRGGTRAVFAAFGLGKTIMQLEALRLVLDKVPGPGLIVAPLGVRQEFFQDAEKLGIPLRFIRTDAEVPESGICITNYESVRDGKLDPRRFSAASLDEASVLRGFGGTKTFREFMRLFAGDGKTLTTRERGAAIPYRFVATATPSPNDYIELLAYAAFLGVMDVGEAKTRFFQRDSSNADRLTLHPHKEEEFWLWVASWGLFIQKPSDVGCPDDGYDLPRLEVRWHEVPVDHAATAGAERDGQSRIFADAAVGVMDAARVKRESLRGRMEALHRLREEEPGEHRVIWHDLEDERRAIEEEVPGVVSVYGSQDLEEREQAIVDFSFGRIRELAAKPVIAGSGCNFQRHCRRAVFLGIGFKFNDFIQAVHRIYRFLQRHDVRIDIIYSEAERGVRETLLRKWRQHDDMVANMQAIVQRYGLSGAQSADALQRSIGVDRREAAGERWTMVNADCVEEVSSMPDASAGLIVTSIPFSTQYEYTPSYNDFGHTDNDAHFWEQMGFLIPELLRVLEPGRVAAIHVKDRIVPGGLTGLGFQTVSPFSDDCIREFRRHGFAFLARKTITTDVVRENNQTYRLGWTEQCKDGSRMGAGLPEYLLLFRRPPSDPSTGYADRPVRKDKKHWDGSEWDAPGGYSRGRWQIDAHGFSRSSGNRLLGPEDVLGLPADVVYKLWRENSLSTVYDFEGHVALAEALEERRALPPTFMLLPPHSVHPDVWTDVTRMRTLNSRQHAEGREMHLCPLQFDIVDRAITQFSEPGDVVLDPFGGIGTVPLRALELGRSGVGVELNPGYWADACFYLRAAEEKLGAPTLFDTMEDE